MEMVRQSPVVRDAEDMSRNAVVRRIKAALRRRSGKQWSVTTGRGTVWGWIEVNAMPKRRTWSYRLKTPNLPDIPENYEEYDTGNPGGHMSPTDRAELAKLLGLHPSDINRQGYNIPASHDYYREAVDRAEGRPPRKIAEPYW